MPEFIPADSVEQRCRLTGENIAWPVDVSVPFETTAEVTPLDTFIGQERALKAIDLALAMRHRGYNVFVSGLEGEEYRNSVLALVNKHAAAQPVPGDWIYVYNFDEPNRPTAIRLPSGQGQRLSRAIDHLLDYLKHNLPKALREKDFAEERSRLSQAYGKRSEALFEQLVERARGVSMGVQRLPDGSLAFVPLKDGKPMTEEEIAALSEEEKKEIGRRQQQLAEFAAELMAEQQELSQRLRQDVEKVIESFARRLLDPLLARIRREFANPEVDQWLSNVEEHLLKHLDRFESVDEAQVPPYLRGALEKRDPFLEYRVNVVVDNGRQTGAPVIVEAAPSYRNLFGTVENVVNIFGQVTTDFTRVKAGSLLRANGGYLLLDIEDALTEPLVWKLLKRALKSGETTVDSYELFPVLATTALKPEPIPINTKLIVFGSSRLYYMLQFLDKDFGRLFKVRADFAPDTSAEEGHLLAFARLVKRFAEDRELPPFDADAVREIVRFSAREAGHRRKVSVDFSKIADLVEEAAHWAVIQGESRITGSHVRKAIEERTFRNNRLEDRIRELIAEGTLRVALGGKVVGQINGLSVLDLGDYRFGKPSRVTASVGVGKEGIINIERETALSGSTHDKGVLILQGYLRNQYAQKHPLSLSASIAFEQSYGWIEGDSASAAELLCLLSALARVPLRQDLAVTGSVDQHGRIQAVGGVNEKVEGFFDVCRVQGLTGTQGVCLPRDNVKHLILRDDVIEAVNQGRFHLFALDHIDDGIELLTGIAAGDVEKPGTFHFLLDQRLREMLGILGEQIASEGGPRIYIPGGSHPPRIPPPLPGDDSQG